VSRRLDGATLVLGLLGGLLLLYLTLPLAYLFFQIEWRDMRTLVADPRAIRAVQVSMVTSVTATAIMTILGVPLGYLLARVRFPGRRLVVGLVFVPMVLPPLVGGILLLLTYGPYGVIGMLSENVGIGLVNNLTGIILAQVFVASPYVVIASISAFSAVDIELEHAAATLGDYRWQIVRRVSLPLAWPGIAAGITLAWVRTLGEFGATLVMAYHPNTLPVFLWVQLTSEGLRAALPLALILMVIGAGTVAVVHLLGLVPGLTAGIAPETSWRKSRTSAVQNDP
jgi:molybdate/tungstate transport system permease protein